MLKGLYVFGTTLAVGLTWFFAFLWLLEWFLGQESSDFVRLLLLCICLCVGAVTGWNLFGRAQGTD